MSRFRLVMGLLIIAVLALLIVVAYGDVLAEWADSAVGLFARLRERAAALLNPPPPDSNAPVAPASESPAPARWRTMTKLLSLTLAFLLGVFALGEGRYRLRQHLTLNKKACPRCSGEIVRIHRTGAERLFSALFLSGAYHYKCKTCGWNGLRRRRYHGEHADD